MKTGLKPIGLFVTLLGVAGGWTFCVPQLASAAVSNVEILDRGPMGVFDGRQYTWVSAIMVGVVNRSDGTTGAYRVPITLNFPDQGGNGFGFVDVVNNADFFQFDRDTAGLDRPIVSYSGDSIFADFLRREGFTYLSIQWHRTVTEILGPTYGHIERATDGNQIVTDAANLLKNLETYISDVPGRPSNSSWLIGHGQSGSGSFLRGFVFDGYNRSEDGTLVFDGLFITGSNAQRCRRLVDDETPQAPPRIPVPIHLEVIVDCLSLPLDGALIHLRTETELERVGSDTGSNPNERVYDLVGVSHIPEFSRTLRFIGANRQNPISWQPVAKSLLVHLIAWIRDGTEPPAPIAVQGEYDEAGIFWLSRDADGNALGGIRLPHMPSTLPDGLPAGAPLGVYGGLDDELDRNRGFGFGESGGTFVPFGEEELKLRYPTRATYVELVARAARDLQVHGFILDEDVEAYIEDAQLVRLPHFH